MFDDHPQSCVTLAKLIDHTLLKPEATQSAIERLCEEALTHHFATVCVNPYWVALAVDILGDTEVGVCTVVGFPLGAQPVATKLHEAELALTHGAHEIDMVVNIGAAKSGQTGVVAQELTELAALVHSRESRVLKVILETCLLSTQEKLVVCSLAVGAGVDFVKTSTGFSTGGATAEDVRLMRTAVAGHAQVKASGGIRSLAALREMVDAGATRIGTSSGVSILQELQSQSANFEGRLEPGEGLGPAHSSVSGSY